MSKQGNISNAVKLMILSAFFLNLFLWLLIAYNFRPSSDPVALHYNIYFSIDRFGLWYKAYIMPLIGLLVFFLNTVLGFLIYKKDKILSYCLFLSSVVLQVIFLFAAILIIIYI